MRSSVFLDYYRGDEGRQFLARQAVLLAVAALVLLALFASGSIDRVVTQRFFDAASGAFPWTNDWWLKTVLHDAARTTSALGAVAWLAVTIAAWLVPRLVQRRGTRHSLAFVTGAAFAAAVTVVVTKHLSGHACPWDLVEFGGRVPFQHVLDLHAAPLPVDGCFPAAHPLAGYGWLAIAFALYPAERRLAAVAAVIALALGTLFGVVQVVRGAHFLSHVLWTAWSVWAVNLGLLALCRPFGARVAALGSGVRAGAVS